VLERRLLPQLLVAKDLNNVLELCKSCPFSVYVLPLCFGPLGYCLSPHDGFLFLTESLDLLLDSEQLLLFCGFIFEGFFFSVFHLKLLGICILLDYLTDEGTRGGD
jgi:predicted CDP-diglyceride synthetase/phosphatidate cytidylyltransferase